MWWMVVGALAKPSEGWSELARELATSTTETTRSTASERLEQAPSEDHASLEAAVEMASLLEEADPPFTPLERQVLFEAALNGTSSSRAEALSMARRGEVAGALLLPDLHHELALLAPVPRLKALQRLKASRLDADTLAKIEAAYATAYPLRKLDLGAAAVSDRLAEPLGNDPGSPYRPETGSLMVQLEGLDPDAEISALDAAWELVEGDDRRRLDSARNVSRTMGAAVPAAERRTLLRDSLSESADVRAEALTAAEKRSSGVRPTPVTDKAKREALLAFEKKYIRVVPGFSSEPSAPNTPWHATRGGYRLNPKDWGDLADPAVATRARRRIRGGKRETAAGLTLVTAGAVGSIASLYGVLQVDDNFVYGTLASSVVGLTGTLLAVSGAGKSKPNRNKLHRYYTDRNQAQDVADRYNSELGATLKLSEEELQTLER